MQDAITLSHANTFFFITTIAVAVGTILLLVLTFIFVRILKSIKIITARIERLVDKTSGTMEDTAESATLRKSLPFLLSVVSLFTRRKKVAKK